MRDAIAFRHFLHQAAEGRQGNLSLTVRWRRFVLHKAPDQIAWAVVDLLKPTLAVQLDDEEAARFASQRDRVTLRRLDLDIVAAAHAVVSGVRCGMKLYPVVMCDNALTKAPYHVAIGRKATTRKHRLQLADDVVEVSNQSRQALFIHASDPFSHQAW